MMKAIRITKENKDRLEAQYDLGEGYLELCSGLYLIAGDGNAQTEGIVTPSKMTERFYRTGRKLSNDFFEIIPKEGIPTSPLFSHAP